MAIIKIYLPNPNDGTDTFASIDFGEADDSSGTNATVVATETIDTSEITQITPGYTTYTYTSGDTAKYYAARYKDSSNNVTDWSTWILGGKDKWDTMFENEMDDTANSVFSQATVQRFKEWALEALHPEIYRIVIDESLTISNSSTAKTHTYTVPYRIFNIFEVGVGTINATSTTARNYARVLHDNWRFEGNLLHIDNLAGLDDGDTLRIIGAKKFAEVGEVPDRFDILAMYHMKMSAYLYLSEDFPRFKQWAQLQQGTKVSFENMRVQAREYERKFKEDKARMAVVGYGLDIQ